MLFCLSFSLSLHELLSSRGPTTSIYTLEVLHVIGSPLQGFVNCLLFLTNRTVRSLLRHRGLRAFTRAPDPSHPSDRTDRSDGPSEGRASVRDSDTDGEAADSRSLLSGADGGGGGGGGGSQMDGDEDDEDGGDGDGVQAAFLAASREKDSGGRVRPKDEQYSALGGSVDRVPSRVPDHHLQPFPAHLRKFDMLSVFVGTWNLGSAPPPSDSELRAWLPADQYDVYAVGAQECVYAPDGPPLSQLPSLSASSALLTDSNLHALPVAVGGALGGAGAGVGASASLSPASWSCEDHWFRTVRKLVGECYEVVALQSLGAIRLVVLVRLPLFRYVSQIRAAREGTGVAHMASNKGGVGISMRVGRLSLCFVNAHLAAHQGAAHLALRNRNVVQIVRRLAVAMHVGELELALQFHALFFFGDLNYRLHHSQSARRVLSAIARERWERLVEHDELTQLRTDGALFAGFQEGPLCFPPTYKYVVGAPSASASAAEPSVCGPYDSKKRTPAWCDRVLWRHRRGVYVQQTYYSHQKELTSSDHKPVSSSFRLGYPRLLRPLSSLRPKLPSVADSDSDDTGEDAEEKGAVRPRQYTISFGSLACEGVLGPHGMPLEAPFLAFKAEFLDTVETPLTSVLGRPTSALRFEWDGSGLPSVTVPAPHQQPWTRSDLQTSCVLLVLLDDCLKGEDDVAGVCCVELRDAFGPAPVRFEVPVERDTALNGVVVGHVHARRACAPAAAPALLTIPKVVREPSLSDDMVVVDKVKV